jgi:hypothetical protein
MRRIKNAKSFEAYNKKKIGNEQYFFREQEGSGGG